MCVSSPEGVYCLLRAICTLITYVTSFILTQGMMPRPTSGSCSWQMQQGSACSASFSAAFLARAPPLSPAATIAIDPPTPNERLQMVRCLRCLWVFQMKSYKAVPNLPRLRVIYSEYGSNWLEKPDFQGNLVRWDAKKLSSP